jgi:hypothetical protein
MLQQEHDPLGGWIRAAVEWHGNPRDHQRAAVVRGIDLHFVTILPEGCQYSLSVSGAGGVDGAHVAGGVEGSYCHQSVKPLLQTGNRITKITILTRCDGGSTEVGLILQGMLRPRLEGTVSYHAAQCRRYGNDQ